MSFFHFRDRDGVEVDIVIERGPQALAGVEVKAGATVTASDFRGLRKLRDAAGDRFAGGRCALRRRDERRLRRPALCGAPPVSLGDAVNISPRRLFFITRGAELMVLLCGGDKDSQRRDVDRANRMATEWRDRWLRGIESPSLVTFSPVRPTSTSSNGSILLPPATRSPAVTGESLRALGGRRP